MSNPHPLNSNIPVARIFTPQIPLHDPHLDTNMPKENLHMVPQALFAGRKLNRELLRPATANLHVMLKLTNDPDELQKEFHEKIPQINDLLGLWGEVKGADPTTTGEAQLRLPAPVAEDGDWTSTEVIKRTAFNHISSLDTPRQAEVISLGEASEDSEECAEDSRVPSNLRATEWLDFDGCYIHLEDAELKMDSDDHCMRRESTASNLRVTEWLEDEQYNAFANEASRSESDSDAETDSREAGPYETFWINQTEH